MLRTTVFVAFAMAASAMTPPTALGQAGSGPTLTAVDGGPLLTANPTLHDSLQRIARGSALWRHALDSLRGTGRRALVLTPDEVVVSSGHGAGTDRFDPTVLAEVAPVLDEDSRVRVVLVVINLPLIEQTHRRGILPPVYMNDDLDRVLVHEIYGHVFPYLLAGSLSGRCADPLPGQRPSDACAIQRENAVRAELGLGRRTDSGLRGLALARHWRSKH